MRERRNSGLSLLELLVVLSLVGMVTTVLFQGYGYMLGTYQRIQVRQAHESERALVNGWLRTSLESLLAFTDPSRRFQGSSDVLLGVSFQPLLAQAGLPTAISWELVPDNDSLTLVYTEQGQSGPLTIDVWSGVENAAFSYLGANGEWRSGWSGDAEDQLPRAVRLTVEGTVDSFVVTAVIHTRQQQFVSPAHLL
ncbi:MAG: prepilin-type N-terminal cleavage/methylation domain-containing protein [Pseudomonadota bacterium]